MYRLKGFTLIELLVVIAVIAILAALLFPVLTHVREKARQTHCANNLHQIGLAAQAYEQDYDDAMVPAVMYYGHSGDIGKELILPTCLPLT